VINVKSFVEFLPTNVALIILQKSNCSALTLISKSLIHDKTFSEVTLKHRITQATPAGATKSPTTGAGLSSQEVRQFYLNYATALNTLKTN